MLVDANILLYAVDEASSFHSKARDWLNTVLNGSQRVGLPWQSLTAFLRISTNPRALTDPLRPAEAWQLLDSWLDAPTSWIPIPTPAHREVLGRLVSDRELHGNLIADADLATLCIEHGLTMVSADSDFARFPEITWLNPVA
jgi:uncharacterized protein